MRIVVIVESLLWIIGRSTSKTRAVTHLAEDHLMKDLASSFVLVALQPPYTIYPSLLLFPPLCYPRGLSCVVLCRVVLCCAGISTVLLRLVS